MLRVLTFDEPRLVTMLRTGYFRSLGLRVMTACSADALLEHAHFLAPEVVLVVGDRTPPGYARALRSCLGERKSQMVLVVGDRDAVIDDDLTAYDGVLSLEDPELEMARILAARSARTRRRQARHRVRLPVRLEAENEVPLDGVVVDLSAEGAGLLVGRLPNDAGPKTARFWRDDGRSVSVSARVVWADARAEPATRVGLKLIDIAPQTVRALADLSLWELHVESGAPVIRLHGELDEAADLAPLLAHVGEAPTIDMSDVVRANSTGLLRWSTFLRRLPSETRVRLRGVPAALMRQLVLVPLATLGCVIESHYAPYECEACEADVDLLLDARARAEAQPCPLCAAPMVANEPPLQLRLNA